MPRRNNFWEVWTEEHLASVPEYAKRKLEREWNFRRDVFGRDNFTCQITGLTETEENIYTPRMRVTVHHIIPVEFLKGTKYAKLMNDPDNGITLSKQAHRDWHKGKRTFMYKDYEWKAELVYGFIGAGQIKHLIEKIKR